MRNSWESPFRYIVLVIGGILLLIFLWSVRDMFKPLMTAALIAYLLSPMVNFLRQRTRLTRRAAANIVFFVSLGLLIAALGSLVPLFFSELQGLINDLSRTLTEIELLLREPLIIGPMRLQLGLLVPAVRQTFGQVVSPLPEDALRLLETTSLGLAWLLVIVVSVYYLLTDWEIMREGIIRLPGEQYQRDLRRLYLEIKEVWMSYLRGQVTLILIIGITFTIVWTIIGLPGALILGLLTGLLSLIPELGPLIVTILAAIVALLEGSNWIPISNGWFAILVVGIYTILNNVKNIWLLPRITGHSVKMHEGVVFVALVVAIIFWGVLGALIIVPVLASLSVIGRYVRRRLLGLPPFATGDSTSEPELIKTPSAGAMPEKTQPIPETNPDQEKTSA
jgi:predicted PurR-regulated permease PerM